MNESGLMESLIASGGELPAPHRGLRMISEKTLGLLFGRGRSPEGGEKVQIGGVSATRGVQNPQPPPHFGKDKQEKTDDR